MLLEGQVMGGISMGVGNAFYEQMIYDEDGQLLTASFMDYLIPQATDMPEKIEMGHMETTITAESAGHQGCGRSWRHSDPGCFCPGSGECAVDYQFEMWKPP